METEADRRNLVETLSLGYRAKTTGDVVPVIFDNGHASVDVASGFRINDRSPAITMTEAQARALGLVRGGSLSIVDPVGDWTEYRVRDPQPDGTGMIRVELDKPR